MTRIGSPKTDVVGQLTFANEHVDPILAGRKTATIRKQLIPLRKYEIGSRVRLVNEDGDRPDRVSPREAPREIPDKACTINGDPAEERFASATAKLDQLRSSSDVATDGGER